MQKTAVRAAAAIVVGTLLQYFLGFPLLPVVAAVLVALLLALLESRSLYAVLVFLAMLNFEMRQMPFELPAERLLTLEGGVVEEELFGDNMRRLVRVSHLETAMGTRDLKAHCYFYSPDMETRLGQWVRVRGTVRGRPGSGSHLGTIAGRGWFTDAPAGSFMEKVLFFPLRKYCRGVFARYLDAERSRLAAGLVIGGQSGLTAKLRTVFANAGVTHILAVSGLHITYIVGIFYLLSRLFRVPRRPAFVLIAAALLIYAGVTAFKPSVMRATLMGLLLGLAGVIERKTSLVHLVTVSLIILLFFDPRIIFNVSAQLSYGAVYGILLLMPFFERKLAGVRPRIVRQGLLLPLAVSFSAQLFTAPILAYYFNRLPTMSLLANLVIVPLSAIAVTVGFLVAVVHPISGWLAGVFSGTLDLVLAVMVFAAGIFGGASFSVVKLATPSVLLVALCYSALANWRWRGKFLILLLGMFNVAVWARATLPAALSIYSFEGRNYLALLPSGQSLALVRQPGARWQRFLDEKGISAASLRIEMPRYRRGSLSRLCVTGEQPGGQLRLELGSTPRVGYGAAAFLVDSSSTAVFSDGRSTSRRGPAVGRWARLLEVVNFIGVEGHWPHFYVR